jgi:hypothetical protein
MSSPQASRRCTAAALARGDQLAGTATMVRGFLLVEHPGPWGENALRDSRLPAETRAWLRRQVAETHVRVLLVRRPGARSGGPARVFAIRTGSWCETTVLDRVEDVRSVDVAAVADGRSPGLDPWSDPVLLVCTHGRHDACCAERGRPVAATLASLAAHHVWECSHLGGDRFSGNVLVLPAGLGFGWVDPERAPALLDNLSRGLLDLDLMRGRATLPMAAQYAEIQLRRQLDEVRDDAVRYRGSRREADDVVVTFEVADATYDLHVRASAGPAATLTCRALRENPVPRHEVTATTRR